jgi:hypothetical protein
MSFAKIRGKLTSRIGRPVNFGAPQDVHNKGGIPGQGEIVGEVWVDPELNESAPHSKPCDEHCWGDYSFCSQLIRWSDDTYSIRLAYYRRRCGEDFWEYASQTTVNAEPQIIRALCERTLSREDWFRNKPPVARPPQ